MKRFFGGVLMTFGVFAILAGLIGLFDPVASKMADDGDPFGPPISRYESAAIVGAGVVSCLIGHSFRSAVRRR